MDPCLTPVRAAKSWVPRDSSRLGSCTTLNESGRVDLIPSSKIGCDGHRKNPLLAENRRYAAMNFGHKVRDRSKLFSKCALKTLFNWTPSQAIWTPPARKDANWLIFRGETAADLFCCNTKSSFPQQTFLSMFSRPSAGCSSGL